MRLGTVDLKHLAALLSRVDRQWLAGMAEAKASHLKGKAGTHSQKAGGGSAATGSADKHAGEPGSSENVFSRFLATDQLDTSDQLDASATDAMRSLEADTRSRVSTRGPATHRGTALQMRVEVALTAALKALDQPIDRETLHLSQQLFSSWLRSNGFQMSTRADAADAASAGLLADLAPCLKLIESAILARLAIMSLDQKPSPAVLRLLHHAILDAPNQQPTAPLSVEQPPTDAGAGQQRPTVQHLPAQRAFITQAMGQMDGPELPRTVDIDRPAQASASHEAPTAQGKLVSQRIPASLTMSTSEGLPASQEPMITQSVWPLQTPPTSQAMPVTQADPAPQMTPVPAATPGPQTASAPATPLATQTTSAPQTASADDPVFRLVSMLSDVRAVARTIETSAPTLNQRAVSAAAPSFGQSVQVPSGKRSETPREQPLGQVSGRSSEQSPYSGHLGSQAVSGSVRAATATTREADAIATAASTKQRQGPRPDPAPHLTESQSGSHLHWPSESLPGSPPAESVNPRPNASVDGLPASPSEPGSGVPLEPRPESQPDLMPIAPTETESRAPSEIAPGSRPDQTPSAPPEPGSRAPLEPAPGSQPNLMPSAPTETGSRAPSEMAIDSRPDQMPSAQPDSGPALPLDGLPRRLPEHGSGAPPDSQPSDPLDLRSDSHKGASADPSPQALSDLLPGPSSAAPIQQLLSLRSDAPIPLYVEGLLQTQSGPKAVFLVIDSAGDRSHASGRVSVTVHLSIQTDNLGPIGVDLASCEGISCAISAGQESVGLVHGALPLLRQSLADSGLVVLSLSCRQSLLADVTNDTVAATEAEVAESDVQPRPTVHNQVDIRA